MRCLIETVRRGGVSEARDIDTDRLSLGRGADQDIRLQSRLAGLIHAVIEQGNDGKLRIRAIAANRVIHNGGAMSWKMRYWLAVTRISVCAVFLCAAPPGFYPWR